MPCLHASSDLLHYCLVLSAAASHNMGVPQKAVAWIKPEEYLALEERATAKHEYLDGVIYAWQGWGPEAMAGGSRRHNTVCGNLYIALRNRLQGRPCRVFMAEVRLQVTARRAYFYPDVAVTCAPTEIDPARDAETEFSAPTAVFEVLSDSTETFDRGEKFDAYRHIPSLQDYVLVSLREQRIETYRRSEEWRGQETGPDGVVVLDSLGLRLDSREIFG